MLSQGELLLLQLLSFFRSFARAALTGSRHGIDSDKEKILAVYKLIGEEPVFITPSTFPQQMRFILVGSILLILLFFLYQICTQVIGKKGAA